MVQVFALPQRLQTPIPHCQATKLGFSCEHVLGMLGVPTGTIYSAADEIRALGGKALACVCDVRNDEAIQQTVDRCVAEFGGIDILVNNASAIR